MRHKHIKWLEPSILIGLIIACMAYMLINKGCAKEEETMKSETGYIKPSGIKTKKVGAMMYITDNKGNAMSEGYHYFYRLSNGALIGKTGAMKYLLNDHYETISDGYHEITPLPDGTYRAEIGASVYILDSKGNVLKEL